MAEQHFQLEVHESGLNPHKVANGEFDDDGKPSRTGNLWTTSAHIITAIIGSGVLSLAWCVAQLGWVVGVATLLIFSLITLYTSNLLADCYRSPDPATGKRNYTYTDAVKTNLGNINSSARNIDKIDKAGHMHEHPLFLISVSHFVNFVYVHLEIFQWNYPIYI
ncbi:amino acid permease 5-like [Camellia sinensis]|uniref:amino acid permease 5-like n=1 Tax=Camellia sinensis TaxID=4442 RepID=UPI001035F7E3|nr:amino acid permease 5-like [Camellia sinensis]